MHGIVSAGPWPLSDSKAFDIFGLSVNRGALPETIVAN